MTRYQEILLAVAIALTAVAVAILIPVIKERAPHPALPVTLAGSVLRQDSDPRKQIPLSGVTIIAEGGATPVTAKSGSTGFFSLTLKPATRGRAVVLTFEQAGYQPLRITANSLGDQLYLARLQPFKEDARTSQPETPAKISEIQNVRVRYSFKAESTASIGSLAKEFMAPNKGNVPCGGQKPCSPDGRWKATETTLPLDADEGNEFRNVRVSCIAGPCAFTKLESEVFARPARKIVVAVSNWSDTADFLVEADVTRSMVADQLRHSFPFIVGQTMSFALPAGSEGPSIEADFDGQHVVFPLGPALILSWATCSVEVSPDGSKIYRCQLKSGYRFQP